VNALGNDARPLNKETITAFLDDFGLEAEFALHSHIRGLSGGCYLLLVVVSLLYSFSTLCCVGGRFCAAQPHPGTIRWALLW
jgi:hypothetical protein